MASQDISEQAKKTAQFYGIDFRQISEITQDDMLGWLKISEIDKLYIIREPRVASIFNCMATLENWEACFILAS